MIRNRLHIAILFFATALQSCNGHKRIYTSECETGIRYRQVSFANLVDSIQFYDRQYVEVSGKYTEGRQLSALVSDSLFASHGNSRSLWVNFSQDCPLYLTGTRKGFFEEDDGTFTSINKKHVTLRGRIDRRQRGFKKSYAAAIDMVSYIAIR